MFGIFHTKQNSIVQSKVNFLQLFSYKKYLIEYAMSVCNSKPRFFLYFFFSFLLFICSFYPIWLCVYRTAFVLSTKKVQINHSFTFSRNSWVHFWSCLFFFPALLFYFPPLYFFHTFSIYFNFQIWSLRRKTLRH